MIKRSEDLSQQEIDILDNLSSMFKEGLIDANANIISGKEEEFGFASVKESVEKVFEIKVRYLVIQGLIEEMDKAKFEDALTKEEIEELRKIAEQQEENRPEGDT